MINTFSLFAQAILKKRYSNFTALFLSFLFLFVVLCVNGIYQWQQTQNSRFENARITLDHFVQQTQLLAQSSFQTNILFSHQLAREWTFIEGDVKREEQLWEEVRRIFFNATGFVIFDAQGQVLLKNGGALHEQELSDVWSYASEPSAPNRVFMLR